MLTYTFTTLGNPLSQLSNIFFCVTSSAISFFPEHQKHKKVCIFSNNTHFNLLSSMLKNLKVNNSSNFLEYLYDH